MTNPSPVIGYQSNGASWVFEPGLPGRFHIEDGLFAHSAEFLLESGAHMLGIVIIDHESSGELVDMAILVDGRLLSMNELHDVFNHLYSPSPTSHYQSTHACNFSYRYYDFRAFPRDLHIDRTTGWSA